MAWRKGEVPDPAFPCLGAVLALPAVSIRAFLWCAPAAALALAAVAVARGRRGAWMALAAAGAAGAFLYRLIPVGEALGDPLAWAGLGAVALAALACRRPAPAGPRGAEGLAWMALCALLGYSVQLYTPMRAAAGPAIDENRPVTWARFRDYAERRQYAGEGMAAAMFRRRAGWGQQLGYGKRIGYLGAQAAQFWPGGDGPGRGGRAGRLLAAALPALAAVLASRRRRGAVWLPFSLYLASSLGLVLYLNFSDGTRAAAWERDEWKREVAEAAARGRPGPPVPVPEPDALRAALASGSAAGSGERAAWDLLVRSAREGGRPLPEPPEAEPGEVRERDYFFTPAFLCLSLLASLSLFLAWGRTWERLRLGRRWRAWAPAGLCLSALAPLAANWRACDRHRLYLAEDYARNVLVSCPRDALLFTNGDNDTFPLWYLQAVEGFRTDVAVINFPLSATDWYLPWKGLEPVPEAGDPDAPEWALDAQDRLRAPGRRDLDLRLRLEEPLEPQERILLGLLVRHYPRRPFCFALGTQPDEVLGLDAYWKTVGLVSVVDPGDYLGLANLDANLLGKYRYPRDLPPDPGEAEGDVLDDYRVLFRYARRRHAEALARLGPGHPRRTRERAILARYSALERGLPGRDGRAPPARAD